MKTTFRSLAVMTLLVATFSSCKKDNKDVAGSFTYDSKTYNTSIGQYVSEGSSSGMLMLSSAAITQTNYSGTVSYVSFNFDKSTVPEGTFTFKNDGDQDYDGSKNFYASSAGLNLVVSNNQPTGGDMLYDLSGGTVTITKNGSSYSISYTLTFADGTGTLAGKFNGGIQVMKNPD